MTAADPRVSIGLPVYNGERYLEEALESLVAQTYTDFEIVISDNASTDRTEDICRSFADRDARVRYTRADVNRGGTWNFNRVVELSQCEYFRWAAHDDVVAPTYLERCVGVLDDDPRVALAHTEVELIDADGNSMGIYEGPVARREDPRPWVRFHDAALWSGRNHLIFAVIRRDLLDRIPPYGAYGNADGVLLARLALLGTFVTVDEPLQQIRVHDEQASTLYGVERGGIDYRAWRQWIDAPGDAKRKIEFPYWRIWAEHARSIVAVRGVSLPDRIKCVPTVAQWAWSRKGRMRRDLTILRPNAS
jgi:glycosyltransferase involved in cell wall biosynthesis